MKKNPIRVLVVDDSALMRKLIPQMLAADESIEVVGTALDGSFCLKKIEELKPGVVTLDLEMPGMNGIEALKEIIESYRTQTGIDPYVFRGSSIGADRFGVVIVEP